MAKRKRLSAFGAPDIAADLAPEPGDDMPGLETKAFPTYPLGYAGGHTYTRQDGRDSRPAPIADMAGAAAATAALEEMAEVLRHAKETGRMVLQLPLAQVEAGYLVRDRIAADPEEMVALVESLRARGQQTPIEVVQLGPERFGLISGWRRLRALASLQAETGAAKFGSVLALLRKPDQASDAYVAMVEENEIRVGLSFYERARIALKAVEAGVYPDDRAALRALYAAASRPKRSKIGSFLAVVRALDGALRYPEAIGERLGLQLAQALEADAALGPRMRDALEEAAPGDAASEQAWLARLLAPPAPRIPDSAMSEPVSPPELAPGLSLSVLKGQRLVIEGARVDAAFRARLEDWLRDQG